MKNKTTAILLATLMISTLVGCGAVSSNASEAGASILDSTSSDNDALAENGEVEDAASSDTDDVNTDSESSEAASGDLKDAGFTYNGNSASVMDSFEAVDKAMGGYNASDSHIKSEQSLYYYGKDEEVGMITRNDSGTESIITIGTRKPGIITSRNIKVGSTKDELAAAYGTPNETKPYSQTEYVYEEGSNEEKTIDHTGEEIVYDFGDYKVTFTVENDKVMSIEFKNNVNYNKFDWD